MQRPAWTLLLAVCAALASPAPAENYSISPAEGSHFTLRVSKTGLLSGKVHVFVFERYSGQLDYDAADPTASSVKLHIDTESIVCKDDWVSDKDLAKIDKEAREKMLAVERYTQIAFVSRQVRKGAADGAFEVQGDLTIRDRTKPVAVTTTLRLDASGSLAFEGKAVVKLKDYGLKPPSAAFGMIGTKDEMDLEFRLVARPATAHEAGN